MQSELPAAPPASGQIVERLVRESYGRLVAYLSARWHDVAAAEDALGDALHAALATWPRDGVPRNPEAWLLAAARRRLIDEARRAQVRLRETTHVTQLMQAQAESRAGDNFPDERLKLLFVCAHPAIDAGSRTPLMLQTVLGIDAARIAACFLVSPTAMSQRLVRAKTKIRLAGIPFEVPEREHLPERLETVLEAIYAAYSAGWSDPSQEKDARLSDLADEAITLARMLVALLPDAEAHGLLALLLHCEARRPARWSARGDYIPLSRQDASRWSRALLVEAESQLEQAAAQRRPGRFQLEAAIQSLHVQQRFTGQKLGVHLVKLYDALLRIAPTLGAQVSRAAALGETASAAAGLAALASITAPEVVIFQPYWAVRAELLSRAGDITQSRCSYERAASLTEDPAVRRFLFARRTVAADNADPASCSTKQNRST